MSDLPLGLRIMQIVTMVKKKFGVQQGKVVDENEKNSGKVGYDEDEAGDGKKATNKNISMGPMLCECSWEFSHTENLHQRSDLKKRT